MGGTTAASPPRDGDDAVDGSRSAVIRTLPGLTAKAEVILADVVALRAALGRIRQAAFGLPYLPDDEVPTPANLAGALDAIGDHVVHLLAGAAALESRL
jgi:hypothetical protein